MDAASAQADNVVQEETEGGQGSEEENDNDNQRSDRQSSSVGKKRSFSVRAKVEAIKLAKETTVCNAARTYRATRSTVQGWIKNAEKLEGLLAEG